MWFKCSAKTVIERGEVEFCNKSLVEIIITNRHYNRSFVVTNITTTFFKPLSDSSTVQISYFFFKLIITDIIIATLHFSLNWTRTFI